MNNPNVYNWYNKSDCYIYKYYTKYWKLWILIRALNILSYSFFPLNSFTVITNCQYLDTSLTLKLQNCGRWQQPKQLVETSIVRAWKQRTSENDRLNVGTFKWTDIDVLKLFIFKETLQIPTALQKVKQYFAIHNRGKWRILLNIYDGIFAEIENS